MYEDEMKVMKGQKASLDDVDVRASAVAALKARKEAEALAEKERSATTCRLGHG